MGTTPAILIFFFGQMWWNHVFAVSKGSANSSSPTPLPEVTTPVAVVDFTTQADSSPTSPPSQHKQTSPPSQTRFIKNNRPLFTAKPQRPITEAPKSHNDHLIAAVVIGVILAVMIIAIVGIFLWRRWRRASLPLPHWAGRSPFADGDVPEVAADKEVANGLKRVSVLSLLPWKFNKDTQLLENAEGPLSESRQNLDMPSRGDTEEADSSLAATGNSVSSTSQQTLVLEEPSNLVEVPLQAESPEPLDLPPPPTWLGSTDAGLGPSHTESPEPNAEALCPAEPALHQNPSEALLLPPPPDELLSN